MIISELIEFPFKDRTFHLPKGRRVTKELISTEGVMLRQNIDVGPCLMIYNSTLRRFYVIDGDKFSEISMEFVADDCCWTGTQAEYLVKEIFA